jgi:ParB/RepB/Spo0J family partition protein
VTVALHAERLVAITDLGERLAPLRLADASALAAMRASLAQYGQLSPVRAFERDGALEIFDGFKRLRAARGLGLPELCAIVANVNVVEATVYMRELHAGHSLTALEEAWIVRALYRDHHLSQGTIAARLRRHKSWVCRRLLLVEGLDIRVQADVRLGLLAPRAAVLVAALPRGNQSPASSVVIRRGLTVRQTALLVRELVDAVEPNAKEAVLARWNDGLLVPPRRGVCAARSVAETIALDITTIRKSAGRLQACLAAIDPTTHVLCESLGELSGVLRALSQTIARVMAKTERA